MNKWKNMIRSFGYREVEEGAVSGKEVKDSNNNNINNKIRCNRPIKGKIMQNNNKGADHFSKTGAIEPPGGVAKGDILVEDITITKITTTKITTTKITTTKTTTETTTIKQGTTITIITTTTTTGVQNNLFTKN